MTKAVKKPAPKTRISSEERRRAIVTASLPLFVLQGFRGVTTKMIAQQAGVSEALLYQHFPSKDALFEAVQDQCCRPPQNFELALDRMAPSAEKFVATLFTMATIMIERPKDIAFSDLFPRLIMHSLVEDGSFAKQFMERNIGRHWPSIQACIKAAKVAGDLRDDGTPDHMRWWLAHHTLVGMHMMLLPKVPAVDYKLPTPKLIDYSVRFTLRGVGLTEAAIKRCYNFARLNKNVRIVLAEIAEGMPA